MLSLLIPGRCLEGGTAGAWLQQRDLVQDGQAWGVKRGPHTSRAQRVLTNPGNLLRGAV